MGAVNNFQFAIGNGVQTVFTLMDPSGDVAGAPAVSALTQTDWQGTLPLSTTPRTNIIQISNTFASWGKSSAGTGAIPVITAAFAPGPDGTAGAASRVQFNQGAGTTAGDTSFLSGVATTVAASTYISSVWAKSNTGAPQPLTVNIAGVSINTTVVDVNWVRIASLSRVAGGVAESMRVGQYGNVSHAVTGDFLLAYAQEELGSTPTTYIPNPGAGTTSNTDYSSAGTTVTVTPAPVSGATLAWTGTDSNGPFNPSQDGAQFSVSFGCMGVR